MTGGSEPSAPGDLRRFFSFLDEGRLPAALEALIEGYIQVKTGKPFGDPMVLARLRRAIVAQKRVYWRSGTDRSISYRSGYSVLAYLAYQFPVYYFQSCRILGQMASRGELAGEIRAVDLGTGPGVIPLALITLARYLPGFSAGVLAVEPSAEHREAFDYLVNGFTEPGDTVRVRSVLAADARTVPDEQIPAGIDLLVLSNVLNELPGDAATRSRFVMRWLTHLGEEGTALLVEPADLRNSTALREVQRELVREGFHVHHPCRSVWGSTCGPVPCWSFEEAPPVRETRLQEALAAGSLEPFRYRNTDIKFSSAVLRRAPPPRIPCQGLDRRRLSPLSQLPRHLGRRIACLASVMSGELGDYRSHVRKLCDGTARSPVFAVLPAFHVTPENRAVLDAPYGTVLHLRGVLVRRNPRTRAFNLLVSRVSTAAPCREQQL